MASSIKVSYDGEMRRFAASTYEDLQQRVTQLFDISSFLLKYQDEDGDMVTVSSEWELEEALRCQGPVLKLNVEAAADSERQSGDFILVQKDCVMHVQEPESPVPRQLTIPPSQTQTTGPVAMALTPLPSSAIEVSMAKSAPETVSRDEPSERSQVHTKRTYAEVTESKEPYVQGTHKFPTYIISVPAEGSCHRPTSKAHVSVASTPYVQQGSKSRTPYAVGKHGQEFVKSPTLTGAPYATGKSSPQSFVLAAEAQKPYAATAQAHVPFMRVV
jgi:hypothetical protein